MPHPPDADAPRSSGWWLRGLAIAWMVLFLVWFYSFDLPNGRTIDGRNLSRGDVWGELVDALLENIFPTPPDPSSPSSPPSGWRYLPQRIDIMAVAAFVLASAWGLGHLVLRGLKLRERFDRPTRTVFAFGLGLSGLSLMTLGCGLAGMLSRGLFASAMLLMIGTEVVSRLRTPAVERQKSRIPWTQRQWDIVPILCVVAVAPFALAIFLGAMLPSTDFDVKAYHLEGAKEFYRLGEVRFLSHNVYTSFPFLTEMLALLGMVLRGDWYIGALVGKLVLMAFAPLTAMGLFAAGRRWFSPTVGWVCVLLYLTTPWVYRISIIAYAEGGLTFYLFASLLAVMWIVPAESVADSTSDEGLSANAITLCGLLAGSAVACKYPGVLSVVIPLGGALLLAVWSYGRRNADAAGRSPTLIRTAALFTLGTLITFGPWMAKNIAETGNPVYPLLYNVFGGTDWDAASHEKWQNGHPPAIARLATRPQAMIENLGTRIVDVVARSDWQSPLLFATAPLALLWVRPRRLVIGLWVYVGWLFLTWWALTHQIDRFWVPLLPVVTLLAGVGIGWLIGESNSEDASDSAAPPLFSLAFGGLVTLLITVALLFNLVVITTRLSGYNAYLIDFEAAKRNTTTPSILLLQQTLPAGARVLMVGEAQMFDAEFYYVYNTVFDQSLFELWTSAAIDGMPPAEQPLRAADDIRRTLQERDITHVFVNWAEVQRYRETYGFTDFVTPQRFDQLVEAGIITRQALAPGLPQYELFVVK